MSQATHLTAPRPNLLRAWWPAAIWVCLIACESTDYFSSDRTGAMLYKLVVSIFGPVNLEEFFIVHHYLRKTGHVIGYGILSLLLLRGFRATFGAGREMFFRTASLSWLGTLFVATMDEWHQSYIPSRTGTPWDVLLDSIAGLAFLLLAYWRLRRLHRIDEFKIEPT
jgi:VanZ family protein